MSSNSWEHICFYFIHDNGTFWYKEESCQPLEMRNIFNLINAATKVLAWNEMPPFSFFPLNIACMIFVNLLSQAVIICTDALTTFLQHSIFVQITMLCGKKYLFNHFWSVKRYTLYTSFLLLFIVGNTLDTLLQHSRYYYFPIFIVIKNFAYKGFVLGAI